VEKRRYCIRIFAVLLSLLVLGKDIKGIRERYYHGVGRVGLAVVSG
jgi:hypothetical protein